MFSKKTKKRKNNTQNIKHEEYYIHIYFHPSITFNKTFLQTNTDTKFDFLTAIYVFPHFASDELDDVAKKIN